MFLILIELMQMDVDANVLKCYQNLFSQNSIFNSVKIKIHGHFEISQSETTF